MAPEAITVLAEVTLAPSTNAAQYKVPENVAAENVAVTVKVLRDFEAIAIVKIGAAGSSVGATKSDDDKGK